MSVTGVKASWKPGNKFQNGDSGKEKPRREGRGSLIQVAKKSASGLGADFLLSFFRCCRHCQHTHFAKDVDLASRTFGNGGIAQAVFTGNCGEILAAIIAVANIALKANEHDFTIGKLYAAARLIGRDPVSLMKLDIPEQGENFGSWRWSELADRGRQHRTRDLLSM